MEKVVVIIQARMGSSRLPGKCMEFIGGRPLIYYVFSRISKSLLVDEIVLAAPFHKENDLLCDYVKELGYKVSRGSESDVLQRYLAAASEHSAKVIVRITGDCPLIEASICDKLIKYFYKNKLDYAYLSPHFAEGLDCEVFSFSALSKAHNEATMPAHREHVTLFFSNCRDEFRVGEMKNDVDDSSYRITVDNEEDLVLIQKIVEAFSSTGTPLEFKKIKSYLNENPDIKAINGHIIRNEGLLKSLK